MRRRSHGLTLVETLVVLAIAGLLMAVLLAILMPSDDRKCRLEAERLAAFLTGASAESVMRDAPVRVVFDLDRGTAMRQVAKLGADISSALWQDDDTAEPFELNTPVRFDTVDSAESPERTSGDGYLIFRGDRTDGAVVVLGLEQVFYSVLVPPNGAEITVEKDRKPRPGAAGNGPGRDLQAFAEGLGDSVGASTGNMPVGGLGGVANGLNLGNPNLDNNRNPGGKNTAGDKNDKAEPNTDDKAPTDNKADTPMAEGTPPPDKPAVEVPEPEPVAPPEPEPTPVEEPDPAQSPFAQSCESQQQCGPEDGWGKCDPATELCTMDANGRALLMQDVQILQPQTPTTNLFALLVNQKVNDGQLNLITYFGADQAWLIQGQRAGQVTYTTTDPVSGEPVEKIIKRYRTVEAFPRYAGDFVETTLEVQNPSDAAGGEVDAGVGQDASPYICNGVNQCATAFTLGGGQDSIEIYIQNSNDPPPNTCNYSSLRLQVQVDVRVTVDGNFVNTVSTGSDDGQPGTLIRLTALLGTGSARNYIVPNGENKSLYDYLQAELPLEDTDPSQLGDLNGDDQPDAWKFILQGTAETVTLREAPTADPNARPPYCL